MGFTKHLKLSNYKKLKSGVSVFLFMILAPFLCFGQNLVPNSSFNDINNCAVNDSPASVLSVEYWYEGLNTPDFFNYCFNFPYQVPNTSAGFSHPLNGSTMGGLGLYISSFNQTVNREIVSVELLNTLNEDAFYCITFFYKNAQSEGLEYSTNMISAMFTTDTIIENDIENPNVQQQNQVDETYNGWRKFKSYYQPQGGENTFSIGYFGALDYQHEEKDDPTHFLYYFIDSVRVEECDKDSALAVTLELPNVFTPNEDGTNDFYEVKTNNLVSLKIIILNRWGNIISEYDGLTQSWDGKTKNGNLCTDGVYFVKAIGETKEGEIINKHSFIHLFSTN